MRTHAQCKKQSTDQSRLWAIGYRLPIVVQSYTDLIDAGRVGCCLPQQSKRRSVRTTTGVPYQSATQTQLDCYYNNSTYKILAVQPQCTIDNVWSAFSRSFVQSVNVGDCHHTLLFRTMPSATNIKRPTIGRSGHDYRSNANSRQFGSLYGSWWDALI